MNDLLADSGLIEFIAMVVVLSLVAVSTWVRKWIEKAQQREGGKPVDVGKAVREQLDKYLRAAGQLPPEPVQPEPAAPPVATAPPARAPTPKDAPTPWKSEWDPEMLRDRPLVATKAAVVVRSKKRFRSLKPRPKVRVIHRASKFSPQDVKRAVVQAELLGPPMALRKDYRLF